MRVLSQEALWITTPGKLSKWCQLWRKTAMEENWPWLSSGCKVPLLMCHVHRWKFGGIQILARERLVEHGATLDLYGRRAFCRLFWSLPCVDAVCQVEWRTHVVASEAKIWFRRGCAQDAGSVGSQQAVGDHTTETRSLHGGVDRTGPCCRSESRRFVLLPGAEGNG